MIVVLSPIERAQPYLTDPDLAAGAVYYPARQAPGFDREIVIEPRRTHMHTVAYQEIAAAMKNNTFEDFGPLPDDFRARFKEAIRRNALLNRKEKERWTELVA